ncbi:putative Zn-dependent peptidase [Geomicrobium halophilum]|uniref:Putative Zn-dependent peptidase n=1 Tax=Geomicrobium halophilum TaxID=549000 RepID=A0A841PKI2_9BACL|nr:pitrilysin family protein [Geomicrobium halophilum]MBB6449249.1 putative Zn-dependent peptidase [Geomicrobium halophilum]
MEKKYYEQIDETIYLETLANGLKVYVLPKPGNNKTFSVFTTDYGSIDQIFTPLHQEKPLHVPDGIAHFLEHKLFEDEEGDAFHTFSQRGAQTNAFTSFTRTAYLFSSTTQLNQNLETLVDFVQHPYFTEESVEKEKGIIGQEINMYNDDADWRLFFGLISSLYKEHPVRIDIAGTVQSIDQITKDLLYTCYQTFYHPSNMVLFVVGPVEPEETIQLVKDNQDQKDFPKVDEIKRFYGNEPTESGERHKTIEMNVQTPKCLLGFKEPPNDHYPLDGLTYELAVQLLLDVMFGSGSSTYEQLYKEGLIDNSFSADFTMERSFGFSALGGDTKDPERLVSQLEETIHTYKQKPLNEEEINIAKKRKIGTFMKQLNSPEFIATQFTRYEMNGDSLFEVIPTIEKVTLSDLETVLQRHFQPERSAVTKVIPKES